MFAAPTSRKMPSAERLVPAGSGGRPATARTGAVLLAAAIFCLDAFTPADLAVAGLYVLVLLIAVQGGGAIHIRTILGWSAACAVLTLLGYVIFNARGAPSLAAAHLLFSLTVIVVTTLLLLRGNTMNSRVEQGERRYRTMFDTLAVAVWEHDFTQVEAAVRRLRENGVVDLRRFVGENPAFVASLRAQVRITDVNATALRMMGVGSKDAFFTHLGNFLPETDESFAECIVALDERRPLFQAEATVLTLQGEPRQVIVAFGLGPDASLDRVPGSILDVTERRSLEAQVLRTREELTEAQRSGALAAMSAAIAHELNQPMSAIHSYADAARRWTARTPPNHQETALALSGLSEAVEHARAVMGRVRSLVGNAQLEVAEIDLEEVLTATIELMRREAAAASSRIDFVRSSGEPVRVDGDRILLKQMFVNLIANAIQAMTAVPAAERVASIELSRDGSEAVVSIADRGPGWQNAAEAKVFDSFYTTKRHGMGLGLAISRTTVERHGGTIDLRNGETGGAVVEITIPLSEAVRSGMPQTPQSELLAYSAAYGRYDCIAVQRLFQ